MRAACIIGTRGSSLSLCQTQIIQTRLEERVPGRRFVLKTIKAAADRQPDVPLVAMSGEGIFVKELETALLKGEIDLAVHSMKDLPLELPKGLCVAAVTERQDARDALASRSGQSFAELPAGSRVGTSSLRRRSQLLFARRDLEMMDIRGNVDTRLRKLDEGRYDAVVLAACGLIRLGLEGRITEYLPFEQMLPEPGQGALGIEARRDDDDTLKMLQSLDDPTSRACVETERAFLNALGGGCRVPIAAYAQVSGGTLQLDGAVLSPDGSRRLHDHADGSADSPVQLGEILARRLIDQGAEELLKTIGLTRP
ncbi:MAG: hydroxymethylbilane synthase [Candidatus Omnitrophica bacterium]|nr:hydroxymethylbilane synthase [Candidatus Omnitrophota bacterium]